MGGVTGLILTSENAVRFAPRAAIPAYCVGPRTATASRAAGFVAEILGPDADGLVRKLADRRPSGRLLHLHGTHTRGDVARRLRAAGISIDAIAVYDQRSVAPDAALTGALAQPNLIVPLFSPRSAALFAQAARELRPDTQILALSQAVADALPEGMRVQTHVVPAPNGTEMRAAIERFGVRPNSP